MAKKNASLVVEIAEITGLRLSDDACPKLEKLLAEVGTRLAADYPAPVVGNAGVMENTAIQRMEKLIRKLERAPNGNGARSELLAVAACLLARVCALDLASGEVMVPMGRMEGRA
ncbi:hypothetical protein J2847_005115 [Azospirillum agricola]|uniref:hypothetical protein n=1 Tax=Azospirillum agricola TaxID=1720247 RepID=UPI001AE8C222|nr:hypothetical protein [Azospirillum agricola]MBP2231796.1 hypothetical protein [Azospirillum agricola]